MRRDARCKQISCLPHSMRSQVTAACASLLSYSRCIRTTQFFSSSPQKNFLEDRKKRTEKKEVFISDFLLLVSHTELGDGRNIDP